jgi:Putative cyclase
VLPTPVPRYDDLPLARGGGRSAWGVFGNDDSVGRLNLQRPAQIAQAAQLIRDGECFSLNAPLTALTPPLFGRRPLQREIIELHAGSALDDIITSLSPQGSSQWDALAHVAYDPSDPRSFYNGRSAAEIRECSLDTIEHWARRGIAGRGVLLDLRLLEEERIDPFESRAITVAELEQIRSRADIEYSEGMVLLLHTGFLDRYALAPLSTREQMSSRAALTTVGLEHSEAMARYLWDSGAAAIAADNPAVEVWPPDERPEAWPYGFLHRVLIGGLGFALGELWWLKDLADACARRLSWEMFITSAPLNIEGGIGSTANALAFV